MTSLKSPHTAGVNLVKTNNKSSDNLSQINRNTAHRPGQQLELISNIQARCCYDNIIYHVVGSYPLLPIFNSNVNGFLETVLWARSEFNYPAVYVV